MNTIKVHFEKYSDLYFKNKSTMVHIDQMHDQFQEENQGHGVYFYAQIAL